MSGSRQRRGLALGSGLGSIGAPSFVQRVRSGNPWRFLVVLGTALVGFGAAIWVVHRAVDDMGRRADALANTEYQAQQALLAAQAAERLGDFLRTLRIRLDGLRPPENPSASTSWLSMQDDLGSGVLLFAHDDAGRPVAAPPGLTPEERAMLGLERGADTSASRSHFLTVTRPLAGHPQLEVTALVDPASLHDRLFAPLGQTHDAYVWAIDQYRTVVSAPDPSAVGTRPFDDLAPEVFDSLEPVLAAMTSSSSGVAHYDWPTDAGLQRRLVAYAPVPGRPDVSVAHSASLASVLERTQALHAEGGRTLRWLVGILGGALLLGLLAAVVRWERSVRQAAQLGQYVLEEELGRGGMGIVYRARHALMRRPTALKLLGPEATDASRHERFEQEVRATAKLSHPNTITIYDYGHTPEGVFYYAMELLDGVTLEQAVSMGGPFTQARVVHVLRQVAGALAEAHEAHLVHRDIKPANVMLARLGGDCDVAKVLDFGLVCEVDAPSERGTPGRLLGTPAYMAPEAFLAPTMVDARADLYALGCVAHFLLTGRDLFEGGIPELFQQHVEVPPPLPSRRFGTPIHPGLEALVMACLEKDREARPATARELVGRLEALAAMLELRWTRQEARAWWERSVPERRPRGPIAEPWATTVAVTLDDRAA
jgi:hypothetical protein